MHVTQMGEGPPLVLLHQAPRSWDEFREFIPLVAAEHRVVAMDMVGFGASVKVPGPQSIELYARGVHEVLAALGISDVDVLGHHTGALVALEVAAASGANESDAHIGHLVLSSCPFTGPERRARPADKDGVDCADRRDDGSHLMTLWNKRFPYYPSPRGPLLDRFLRDALTFGIDPAEGHRACDRYRIEDRIGLITSPTLLTGASDDPFAMPNLPPLRKHLTGAASVRVHVVDGGTVALFEDKAAEIAGPVKEFLRDA